MKLQVYDDLLKFSVFAFLVCSILNLQATTPLGMFVPYDINIKQKMPATNDLQFSIFGEKSYQVTGYATDDKEDKTFVVDVLQIYEKEQNIVSMYQGFDDTGAMIQTLTTPFTQLLDSIAGGPGGGVSNLQNGLYTPTGKLSCGQIDFGATYAIGNGFYISAFLPICFAQLSNVDWKYSGTNTLFSGEKIQTELIHSFAQDAQKYFNLDIGNWNQKGIGDLTFLAQWQRDFAQRRVVLKNVQANIRLGISFPTGIKTNESIIMPVPFGSDGSIGIPFGGGLGFNLGNIFEVGFSGQFWYFWSNEKCRRIKTFPTQTSLLFPIITNTYKEFAFLQNFNLYAQIFSTCKRFSAKAAYHHWRRQKEKVITFDTKLNFDVVNSAKPIDELTRHQFTILAAYSPRKNDFERIIPQFEIFWKGSFGGTRIAIASTYGAQFSLIF